MESKNEVLNINKQNTCHKQETYLNYVSIQAVVETFLLQKFKVTHWPVPDYGKFYDGDSYIILNVSQ